MKNIETVANTNTEIPMPIESFTISIVRNSDYAKGIKLG